MKKIGIIGAGSLGSRLAKKFQEAGHAVRIANSGPPESLKETAASWGAEAASVADLVTGVDIVVIAVPVKAIEDLPRDLFANSPESLIIVDAGNYSPENRDANIAELDGGMPDSVYVAGHFGRPVIKAFNSITGYALGNKALPPNATGRIAVPVSGDDPQAKATIIELIDQMGFDGVDLGSLTDSWRQQSGGPLFCTDHTRGEIPAALEAADKSRLASNRKRMIELLAANQGKLDMATVHLLLRSLYSGEDRK